MLGSIADRQVGVAAAASTLIDFIAAEQLPDETAPESLLQPESLLEDEVLQQPIAEYRPAPMDAYPDPGMERFGVGPDDQPPMGPRPISWISGPYLRYGVDFVIGEGILEGGQKLGWGINGGFRQPLGPGIASGRTFIDFGGGYLSGVGNTNRILPGLATLITGTTQTIDDAFSVNLTEVKRASVNVALGWYWGDVVDRRGEDPRLRFATRFGARYGSVRGRFLEELIIDPPITVTSIKTTYLNTDTFGGMLLGTEVILLNRTYGACNVQWTADVEFANDWMEFGGFDSGSLGTASLMTGFMLAR